MRLRRLAIGLRDGRWLPCLLLAAAFAALLAVALPAGLAAQDSTDTSGSSVVADTAEDVPTFVPKAGHGTAGGDSAHTAPARLAYDTSLVEFRMPAHALRRYRDDDDFTYNRAPRDPETIWQKILAWLYSRFRDVLGDGASEFTFWKWVSYAVAAAAVVFVVLKLLGTDLRGLFLKKNPNRVSPFAELDEDINGMDFDVLVDEAVASHQYRRAVRLLYLKALKALADRGMIDWRKDKTNHAYLRELREAGLRESFTDATQLFEYVWYGDVPISESIFRSVRENLDTFISSIPNRS